jgi:hypothetical protein
MIIPVNATITDASLTDEAKLEIKKQLDLMQKIYDDAIRPDLNTINFVITHTPPDSHD